MPGLPHTDSMQDNFAASRHHVEKYSHQQDQHSTTPRQPNLRCLVVRPAGGSGAAPPPVAYAGGPGEGAGPRGGPPTHITHITR